MSVIHRILGLRRRILGLRRRILGLRRERPQVSAKGRSPEKDFSQRFSEVPGRLVVKVNGSLDESIFRNAGRGATDQIVENVNLKRAKTILDFGCGLGRVLVAYWERTKLDPCGIHIDTKRSENPTFASRKLSPASNWPSWASLLAHSGWLHSPVGSPCV